MESVKKRHAGVNFRISIAAKRVLVTGHTGFKGSWLVRILMEYGCRCYWICFKRSYGSVSV